MGLAFKPNTDDMREAPSLVIIDALLKCGAHVQAYDPVAMDEAKHLLPPQVVLTEDSAAAANGADAVVLVTEWAEFRLPDWDALATKTNDRVVFDGRNIYNAGRHACKGFAYGIGIK